MLKREIGRIKRHRRIRKKIFGTPERPRLSIHRSIKNIYAQVIDDTQAKTLVSFSTKDKNFTAQGPADRKKTEAAKKLGQLYATVLKEKGIQKIAFDRGGYLYHGRVKALADGLREGGVEV